MLTGRLVKDAEMSFLPGTGMPKITFTIAVDRAYQKDKNNKKVDFIACEQIGKHTEKLAQYLTKGKRKRQKVPNWDSQLLRRSAVKISILAC